MKKTAIASALALAMGAGVANAAPWTGTFTMYDPTGATVGVDPAVVGDVNTAAGTATLSSPTPFFGLNWTASDVTLYGPGTHQWTFSDANGSYTYTFDVGAGQMGTTMLFAWGASSNIGVVNVWDVSVGPCAYGANAGSGTCTNYYSTDWDGDGIRGAGMINGPFPGFNANFDMSAPVPVPAAVWLFGSGLVGLVGVARRRKKASA